jgi:hypothetical protein
MLTQKPTTSPPYFGSVPFSVGEGSWLPTQYSNRMRQVRTSSFSLRKAWMARREISCWYGALYSSVRRPSWLLISIPLSSVRI